MLNSGQVVYVKFNASGVDAVLQAAVAGKSIALIGLACSSDSATAQVVFKSGTTAISGTFNVALGTPLKLVPTGIPYVCSAVGQSLVMSSFTGGTKVSGVAVLQII